jgi:hypothetical protein
MPPSSNDNFAVLVNLTGQVITLYKNGHDPTYRIPKGNEKVSLLRMALPGNFRIIDVESSKPHISYVETYEISSPQLPPFRPERFLIVPIEVAVLVRRTDLLFPDEKVYNMFDEVIGYRRLASISGATFASYADQRRIRF